MIRAGSLYFAIFISLVVNIILASVILFFHYSNSYIDTQITLEQIDADTRAGITLALYDTSLFMSGMERSLRLYETEDPDSDLILSKEYWGVFQIIRSSATWKNMSVMNMAMSGADLTTGEEIALYVADKDRYLSFSGATAITGTCYLPKLGVRMAFIEGQNFTGDKLVEGEIKTSNPELPPLRSGLLNANKPYFGDTLPGNDSIAGTAEIMNTDTIIRSFQMRTLLIYSKEPVVLDHISLSGNIRIVSSQSIYVTKNLNAENIILYAPSIYFEKGFTGCLQAFAQDTLIAAENCDFTYPSCLGLISENINGIYMELKDNTRLAGCVFIHQDNKGANEPYLKINENAIVQGQVYCPGTVELKGRIAGSLYCHGFALRTFSAFYENYLLNATVDRPSLSGYYAGSFLLSGYEHAKMIQWLN